MNYLSKIDQETKPVLATGLSDYIIQHYLMSDALVLIGLFAVLRVLGGALLLIDSTALLLLQDNIIHYSAQ